MPDDIERIQTQTGDAPTRCVIWLHGLGADGNDFYPIVPQLGLPSQPAVRFVFPHAPMRPITINGGMVMRGWYDISGMEIVREEDETGMLASVEIVKTLIDEQIAAGVEPGHIVLAGFSQGGAIALLAGLTHPQRLGGIMALSTYLPMSTTIETRFNDANRDVPIFMAHGVYDPVIALPLAQASYDKLKAHNFDVEWHTYPMPHAVLPEEIEAVGQWLGKVLDL